MTVPVARVGDIAEQVRGVTYQKEEVRQAPSLSHVALLTAGNITESGINYDDVVYVPDTRVNSQQALRKGDVLIAASSGSLKVVGKAGRIKSEVNATFGAFCKVLRPTDAVDPVYFSHFFRTPEYRSRISHLAAGANINNLRNDDLNDLELPVPRLPEQRRIAAILDQADELRAKRRRALGLLEELTDSLFIEMFGDPMHSSQDPSARRLEDIVIAVIDCPHTTPTWVNSGVVCLRTPNLVKGGWDFSETRFVSEATHTARTKRASLEAGDIVLSREGTVGVGAIIGDELRASMGQRLVQIRPNRRIATSEFLLAYLMEVLQPERLSRLLVGSTAKHINVRDLRALPVLVPPVERQAQFAARMVLIRDELRMYTAELSILDEIFASLQHRAFRGEL